MYSFDTLFFPFFYMSSQKKEEQITSKRVSSRTRLRELYIFINEWEQKNPAGNVKELITQLKSKVSEYIIF